MADKMFIKMQGMIFSFTLQRAAEIIRDPSSSSTEEREMIASIFEELGKIGEEEESMKLATGFYDKQ